MPNLFENSSWVFNRVCSALSPPHSWPLNCALPLEIGTKCLLSHWEIVPGFLLPHWEAAPGFSIRSHFSIFNTWIYKERQTQLIPHVLSGEWGHYYTSCQPFSSWMNILFICFITVNDLQSQDTHTPGLGRVHIMLKCAVSWSSTKVPSKSYTHP